MECSLPAVDDQEDESREPQDDMPLDIPEHYTQELAKRQVFCHDGVLMPCLTDLPAQCHLEAQVINFQ